MNRSFAILAAAAFGLGAVPASATPITLGSGDVGSTFQVAFDGFADGTVIDGLTSTLSLQLTSVDSNEYVFDYTLTNTTDPSLQSRVSSFAFNTNPQISGASATGDYSYTVLDSNYPNGIGTVDVCFKAAASNSCAGNRSGAEVGESGSGSLTLTFADALSSLTLDDFFVRYQSISGAGHVTSASGKQTSSSTTSGSTTSTSGTPVPEPGMLGLFGAALLGLGLMRRRKVLPARSAALA